MKTRVRSGLSLSAFDLIVLATSSLLSPGDRLAFGPLAATIERLLNHAVLVAISVIIGALAAFMMKDMSLSELPHYQLFRKTFRSVVDVQAGLHAQATFRPRRATEAGHQFPAIKLQLRTKRLRN